MKCLISFGLSSFFYEMTLKNTKKPISRYHERYYPESIYTDDRHDHEEERAQIRNQVSIYLWRDSFYQIF